MSTQKTPREWIEHLVKRTFDCSRTARSNEYKAGLRMLLTQRFIGSPMTCPHKPGTAEYDAFFAGAQEGYTVWADHVAAHRPAT